MASAPVNNKSHTDFPTYVRDNDAENTGIEDVITGSSGSIYTIYIDNSLNSADSFLKLYNSKDPTIGTTIPEMIVEVQQQRLVITSKQGIAFDTACSAAVVTTGGTAGTSSPSQQVSLAIIGS
jgi:hypothetical protein